MGPRNPFSGLRRLLNDLEQPGGDAGTIGPAPDEATTGSEGALTAPGPTLPAMPGWELPGASGWIGPYQLLDVVGEGGMGIVYRAYDRQHDRVVALKTLQRVSPLAIYRFKQEFRSLTGLSHPNLVTLYELLLDGARWCLTMELVEGVTFMRHLPPHGDRPAMAPDVAADRLETLRQAFVQLADGVSALHAAGTLHRDIKPSNVLVTSKGRVVVLDFGLAAALDRSGLHPVTTEHLVGTIAYMSPEHAAGQAVGPASDWYSVGVMLYEALTGRLPFEGTVSEILQAKGHIDPPRPAERVDGVPADLDALCVRLLDRNPELRPDAAAILDALGHTPEPAPARSHPRAVEGPFVGREREMAALHEAYRETLGATPVMVHVRGESGAGKTALLSRFLEDLAGERDAVILTGRCYEQEVLPFKALDSLLDALARYLLRLPAHELGRLLPRDIRAIARVFPVLYQVALVAEAPRSRLATTDPQELRRRAAVALRELLGRIGDRRRLVLAIDDLQWGDVDSASLLTDILTPPQAPVFLCIGCCRSEDAESSPFLGYLRQSRAAAPAAYHERHIAVEPLEPPAAAELTRRLLTPADERGERLAQAISRESEGRPFLVYELVEYVRARADLLHADDPLTLDAALRRRIEQLPADARALLEVVAVAGRPIDARLASHAGGLAVDARPSLAVLRAGRLIRGRAGGTDTLECYHDTVREAVVRHLPPDGLRTHHRRLAEAIQYSSAPDDEALAVHYEGAGDVELAAFACGRAAAAAAGALAFDHAAALYRRALALTSWAGPDRCRLRTGLGEALANAGRGADAAAEYLSASADADAAEALELRRRAALLLLTSGHVDEGLRQLAPVLRAVHAELARTPALALVSLLLNRARLRLRGLGFVQRAETAVAPDALQRIDIGWSVVVGLSIIDPIRSADFQTRSLLLALRAGEPFRVARALAVEAGHLASTGQRARAASTLASAERLAARLARPYATGMVELTRSTMAYFAGAWRDALRHATAAATTFRDHCTGAIWEIDTAHAFALWSLMQMGDIVELNRRCPALLKEAFERGDLYAATNVSTQIMTLVSLAADAPGRARADLDRAMRSWSQNGYHVQHHDALHAVVPLEIYCGNPGAAWQRVQQEWSRFRWSLLSQIQAIRIEMLQLRAFSALAMAAAAETPDRFLRIASRDARRLRREELRWTHALAAYIEGAVVARRGDRAAAERRLATAAAEFAAVEVRLHEAVTNRRLAALGGAGAGAAREAAEAWFTAQGIRNPDRLTAAYAPGFPD